MLHVDGSSLFDPKELVKSLHGEVAEQLRRTQLVPHGGESGRAREEIIRRFLRQLLPHGFGIDTGFVFDAVGGISRQVDVVIHRADYHPVIEVGGIKHFMVESVVAVIENKAQINGKTPLTQALLNIASVKSLDKTAGGQNYVLVGGTHVDKVVDPRHANAQIFGAIIAGTSMPIPSYVRLLSDFMNTRPREQWPNFYGALNRDSSVYFLTQVPGELPEGTTTPSEYQRIGYSQPGHPLSVPPLLDLAYWIVEYVRRSQIIDFRVGNYFPLSRRHLDGPPVPAANSEMGGHAALLDDPALPSPDHITGEPRDDAAPASLDKLMP
jgi:hypothetical protein